MLAALENSSIKLIVTRNEQTAVFMAATYGRLTGKTWVAISTLGPGATNLMTWVAYAQLWAMPILVITWQKPIRESKQAKFQIIDVVSMMKPITKFSTSIADGSKIPSIIAHAFRIAEEERPGAVHIELPEDIAWFTVAENLKPIVYEKMRRPIPDDKSINLLIDKLKKAKTPLILVGAWANRKRVSKYLTAFIEQHNIPFFTSQMGKWVVDERNQQYIGTAALTSNDIIHDAIKLADLIITIGHDTIEKPTHIIDDTKTEIVHINYFPAEFDELYKPTLQIIGDIGNTMRQLTERKIESHHYDFSNIYKIRQKIQISTQQTGDENNIIWPQYLITSLRSQLSDDAIIALDNGLYKVWFARNYPCYEPHTLLLDNALATMGAWYSSALMAKMLYPEREVIAVVGDWGFMMNLGDLETAVRLWHNLIIIILNDNAYGMIKRKQRNSWYSDFGLDLSNPDFIQLAESFWAKWYRVEIKDKFIETFNQAKKVSGVKIIEVLFEYPKDIV
jgi:acetolactate synthase I/II/III large subunit